MRAPPAAKELRSATRSPECLSFLPSWQKVIGFLAAEMNAELAAEVAAIAAAEIPSMTSPENTPA